MPQLIPVFAYIGSAVGASAATAAATGVAVTATVAAGSVAAYSQYSAGKAAERLNNYNADVAGQQARDAERDAIIMAEAEREAGRRLLATQRAAFGKSGVIGSTGSPLLVMAEQAGQLEMRAMAVRRQGLNAASTLNAQAAADRVAGKQARKAGTLNAFATILGTAATVSSFGARAAKTSFAVNPNAVATKANVAKNFTPSSMSKYASYA